ncbi:DUF4190 domain-containing protein [Micromonospora sp. NPDC047074]|uniref:DUF4190 domain-containing protein n=1 Tax=Micromonospora sp. NPDC047074 TaxID=3154339 RepID=UPI0033CA4084
MVRIPSLSRRSEQTPTDENLENREVPAGTDRDGSAETGVDRSGGPSRPVVTDRDADQTTYRSSSAPVVDARNGHAERRAAERAAVARAATARPAGGDPDPTLERSSTVPADRDRTGTVDPTTRDRADAGDPTVRDHDAARAGTVAPTAERSVDRDGDGVPDREEPPVAVGPKPRASMLATLGLVVGVAGALFVLTGTLAGYGIGLGAVGAVLAVLGLMATRRRHIAGKTDALLGIVLGLGAVVLGVLAMTGQFDWPTTDGDWVQRFREWLDSQFVDRF